MHVLFNEPMALCALAALPLAAIALARPLRRRVIVPSTVIHNLALRDTAPVPRRLPWLILILEAAGFAMLVIALAGPTAVWRQGLTEAVVEDNSMSGGISAEGGDGRFLTVPDAAGYCADVPGDLTAAIFSAAMSGETIVVKSAAESPEKLDRRITWEKAGGTGQKYGIVRHWTDKNLIGAGVMIFAGEYPEAVLYEDGRETQRRTMKGGNYVTVEFSLPEQSDTERAWEIRLEPGDGFFVDDTVRFVQRKKYEYRFSGMRDGAVSAGLKALGWTENEGADFVIGSSVEKDGLEINTEGAEKAGGRVALSDTLAGTSLFNVPATLEAVPVATGDGKVPLLYVEGKAVAAVNAGRRKVIAGFEPSGTAWNNNDGWPVFLGIALEKAGYPLSGISANVTGETALQELSGPMKIALGRRVLKAGLYRAADGRQEAYNATWPSESAAAAGKGQPPALTMIPAKNASSGAETTPLGDIAAISALVLLGTGGILWMRREKNARREF